MTNMTQKLVIGAATLVVGLVIGWAVRGLLSYNTATQAVTPYGSWRVACPSARQADVSCQMIQDILESQSHTEIVRIAVGKMPDGKRGIDMVLPLGVALQPGIELVLGTDPARTAKYRTCTEQGCVVNMLIDAKMQHALDTSKDGKVVFEGAADNKPIAIPISLNGFRDAQRAYRRDEAKRNSWFWRMWS